MNNENLSLEYGSQDIISLSPSESAKDKKDFSMTLCDPDKRMSIGLEEFIDIDDMWDDLDPGILTNEKAKTEFLKSGSRIHLHNPDNLQFSCKIGFVNFNPYFEPQTLFNIMSRKAYNTIMNHELMYSGINMVGLAKNLHVFIGNHQFFVDFIILENISEFVEKGLTENPEARRQLSRPTHYHVVTLLNLQQLRRNEFSLRRNHCKQQDESNSLGYDADAEKTLVDTTISDIENADIELLYDTDTLTEVHHSNNDTSEDVFANEIQSHEQPDSISDTYVVNENNSNIISDIPYMDPNRDKEEHDNVDYEQQRALFASLINNLKCDVENVIRPSVKLSK
ncbi:hypothetical protein Tco_1045484 [Tanacetum coccineum]|uniref:Uncharacterized protein n=1 Tax=Tanacetum coccineum TaxID=301880 RepID=A0ABQ5GTF8_9ASTR